MHLIFSNTKFFHFSVALFYQYLLVPFLSAYLKWRFPNLKKVIIRNSLIEKTTFDAFLSDIDLTFVIDDNSDTKELFLSFLKFKRFFIMLDVPEIYEQHEYQKLKIIQSEWTNDYICFSWYFRKLNWTLAEMQKASTEFEEFKKQRSLKNSLIKISKKEDFKTPFTIQDFPCFERFKISATGHKTICYWSQYLETASGKGLQLHLNQEEFEFLNSLMPGEPVDEKFGSKDIKEVKSALQFHELYLCKSTVRSRLALSKDVTPWIGWIEHLHKQLGLNP